MSSTLHKNQLANFPDKTIPKMTWETVDKITIANLKSVLFDLERSIEMHQELRGFLSERDFILYSETSRSIKNILVYFDGKYI